MYTILMIISVTMLILSAIGVIFCACGYFIEYKDAQRTVYRYKDFTNDFYYSSKLTDAEYTIKNWHPVIPGFFLCLFLVVFSLAGIALSSKNLSERKCLTEGGIFETWDNGLAWECYTIENVPGDDTVRVILDED